LSVLLCMTQLVRFGHIPLNKVVDPVALAFVR
jgi:hypothetical protein